MTGPALLNHGPMFIGTVFNILLFGVMIAQVYIYYTSYRHDKPFLKLFVLAIFLVDLINAAFDVTYIYVCLILHFGNADYLAITNWQFNTVTASTGLMSLMVQLFFTWRIHVLTRNRLLVAIVMMFSLASAVCAIVVSIVGATSLREFAKFQHIRGAVIVWLSCAAVADIMIATILVWHLTGFKLSDMVIDRIIRMTMQTGLVTSIVATIDITLFLASSSGVHLLFNFSLCKLYSNSLMSSLNARNRARHDNMTSEIVFNEVHEQSNSRGNPTDSWHGHDITTSQLPKGKLQTLPSFMTPQRTAVVVHVESHELRDVESHGKDLQSQKKSVIVPNGTSYEVQGQTKKIISSPSDTRDHKISVV